MSADSEEKIDRFTTNRYANIKVKGEKEKTVTFSEPAIGLANQQEFPTGDIILDKSPVSVKDIHSQLEFQMPEMSMELLFGENYSVDTMDYRRKDNAIITSEDALIHINHRQSKETANLRINLDDFDGNHNVPYNPYSGRYICLFDKETLVDAYKSVKAIVFTHTESIRRHKHRIRELDALIKTVLDNTPIDRLDTAMAMIEIFRHEQDEITAQIQSEAEDWEEREASHTWPIYEEYVDTCTQMLQEWYFENVYIPEQIENEFGMDVWTDKTNEERRSIIEGYKGSFHHHAVSDASAEEWIDEVCTCKRSSPIPFPRMGSR